jgi:hypothetical protein
MISVARLHRRGKLRNHSFSRETIVTYLIPVYIEFLKSKY